MVFTKLPFYDCAVLPEFQGKGIGTKIMENLLSQISHCNIILYASPEERRVLPYARFQKNENRHGVF